LTNNWFFLEDPPFAEELKKIYNSLVEAFRQIKKTDMNKQI